MGPINDDHHHSQPPATSFSRRRFLAVAGSGYAALALGACSRSGPSKIEARSPAVDEAEARRRHPGARVHELILTANPFAANFAGLTAATWAYGQSVPGSEIRLTAGDVIRAHFQNQLPEPTTVHWHGIALRNDMDGASGVTQDPIPPGQSFLYEFSVPDPGTFWFHPHVGLQLDRGLYGPLIVEDPRDPGGYDREVVIVLDDWTSGVGPNPEAALEELQKGGGAHAAHGSSSGPRSELLQGAGGDVSYPLYLVNGRPPKDPFAFDARAGERLRIRFINAASDTSFRVALGGHRMTITHTDGFPVVPTDADAILIGMSERYDVVVTVVGEGAYPLVATAEGKANQALAVMQAGANALPSPLPRVSELDGTIPALSELKASPEASLPAGSPNRVHRVVLGGGGDDYQWTINGRTFEKASPLEVRQGERVRLRFDNRTTMFHPMHLHGHTFQVVEPVPGGPRKDSMIVLPKQRLGVDFIADNPGQWVLHCHNVYHMEGGMEAVLSYVK